MRRAIALMALALPAFGADLKIDHVTLAGSHLDEMREAFSKSTGISTEYGGRHSNHATEMALASFPDGSYLELMGIQRDADPAAVASHVWSKFLRENGGPCASALRVTDVNAEIQRLSSAGIRVGAAEKSGRTRPDGIALSWETADAGPGPRGSFFPFLIRDFTPRENRVYPSGKPTSTRFSGVGLVVIGVHDFERSIALYRKAFQLPEPKRQRDATFTPISRGSREPRWRSRRLWHLIPGWPSALPASAIHRARSCLPPSAGCSARILRIGLAGRCFGLTAAASAGTSGRSR